jgi:hypothetical protein
MTEFVTTEFVTTGFVTTIAAGDPARSFLKKQLGDQTATHHCAM